MPLTYKIKDFLLVDDNMVMNVDKTSETQIKEGFTVSYFNGSYKEKFSLKRACLDLNDKVIGYLFYSDNGNKVRINLC